jgi:SAM-dependent methyltransferase
VSRKAFDLYKCPQCGFVFTHGHPGEEEIGRYYDSTEYISHDDKAKGLVNMVYLQARNIMLGRKRRLVEKNTGITAGRILDIGCGTGYFAVTMKKAGWKVTGIEPNFKAREFASGNGGINVLEPSGISRLPEASFDCVTMWHVLEHFHNLSDYASGIKRLLKPGGTCIAAMPNCSSYDAMYYGKDWAAWDVPRHLWHFSPDTFSIFAEKEGFAIMDIKPLPLDVFYISALSEKNRRSPMPLVKGMIKGSFFALKSLFNKERSSSLIYFLKTKDRSGQNS